jgi:hypothetical protein
MAFLNVALLVPAMQRPRGDTAGVSRKDPGSMGCDADDRLRDRSLPKSWPSVIPKETCAGSIAEHMLDEWRCPSKKLAASRNRTLQK